MSPDSEQVAIPNPRKDIRRQHNKHGSFLYFPILIRWRKAHEEIDQNLISKAHSPFFLIVEEEGDYNESDGAGSERDRRTGETHRLLKRYSRKQTTMILSSSCSIGLGL